MSKGEAIWSALCLAALAYCVAHVGGLDGGVYLALAGAIVCVWPLGLLMVFLVRGSRS